MTYSTRSLALLATAALALSACASKPDPVAEPVPVVQRPAPAPVADPGPRVITPAAPVTAEPGRPVPGSIDDFAYTVGGDPRVYFAYDQYTLSPEARDTLRRQAEWLKRYGNYTAVVEGHADERGTRQYNIALGARRANSVQSFLVSQGVNPSRLTTVSYGKERPVDPRSNEEGWARNRNGHTNLRPLGES
ncbi:peptidoglycan-associated lipoprotein Pal [uncultured Algimonas sp.]|uniref:peptidoglycan-associated lipoprotein Pal n=1 Tax=uncultured Algimonas sp. TaxID=1547920 RepID=UPI00262CD3F7|nr:peptidoglycan-associated lipoprotein Pal [uncultured Algimonas sp.]